jgi:hypothetical protein
VPVDSGALNNYRGKEEALAHLLTTLTDYKNISKLSA